MVAVAVAGRSRQSLMVTVAADRAAVATQLLGRHRRFGIGARCQVGGHGRSDGSKRGRAMGPAPQTAAADALEAWQQDMLRAAGHEHPEGIVVVWVCPGVALALQVRDAVPAWGHRRPAMADRGAVHSGAQVQQQLPR